MRKWLCVTAAFLSLLSSGCIKASPSLVIKDDGSGTFDANFSISEASINQFRAMFVLKQHMAQTTDKPLPPDDDIMAIIADPTEGAIKAKIAKYKDLGLELERLKIQSRNAWRFVEIKISFSDIKKLEAADFFAKNGFNLTKRHDGNYSFEKPAARPKGPAVSAPAGDLAVIAPLLTGFSVKFKLEFPGRLIDTNANNKGLYGATWNFDFDSDADVLTKLQEQSFRAIFDGKNLKIPDVKMETDSGAKSPAGKS